MHSAKQPAGRVGADGNQAEIKGPAVGADLGEGGADGEMCEGGVVVVGCGGEGGDGAVAGVAGGC